MIFFAPFLLLCILSLIFIVHILFGVCVYVCELHFLLRELIYLEAARSLLGAACYKFFIWVVYLQKTSHFCIELVFASFSVEVLREK